MKLAYARSESSMPSASVPDGMRPTLYVVPNPLPALPRRPSRRAVVRAQVWGVPVTRHGSAVDRMDDRDVDARIAEAVRLLAHL